MIFSTTFAISAVNYFKLTLIECKIHAKSIQNEFILLSENSKNIRIVKFGIRFCLNTIKYY